MIYQIYHHVIIPRYHTVNTPPAKSTTKCIFGTELPDEALATRAPLLQEQVVERESEEDLH